MLALLIKEVATLAAFDNLARKLTIIPASTPETVVVRVAAYCRVSSNSDDQLNSFAAQNTYYTTLFSEKENWIMVDIYADEGITGTCAEKREDFQRLMRDCRKGQIDKIYTKSISRFARNTKDCLEATRELKAMGIGVVFEEQHIDTSIVSGEMLTAVFAACAQAESDSISKNTKWGIQKRMQNGSYLPSHQAFGFELIDGKIAINVFCAQYVCEIFQLYLSGKNMAEISAYMREEKEKYHELQNWGWTHRTISCLLRNEKYIGDSLWQKTYVTDTLPRKDKVNRGELQRYYVENTHPAIIEKRIFQHVQTLLEERKKTRSGIAEARFSRTIICETCGKYMRSHFVRGIKYRKCRSHAENMEECPQQSIIESEIEYAFCRLYYKLKQQGTVILEEVNENLETIRERQMLWSPCIIELNRKISNITSQSHKLTLLNEQGAVDSDVFISKTNQLAEQLRKAKREKDKLLQQQEDDTLRKTREIIQLLDCGPDYLDSFDEELFRELIDKIIVESNERIRFRLKNGLELPEYIERTVR